MWVAVQLVWVSVKMTVVMVSVTDGDELLGLASGLSDAVLMIGTLGEGFL